MTIAAAARLVLVACGVVTARQEALDSRWERFPVFVWFFGGPPLGPDSLAILKRHGLGGCNVEGSESSDRAHAAGVDFYVDHVAGKGDLFLRPKRFDADRERLKSDLLDFRPSRPNCFNDPDVRARLQRLAAESVARHAGHAPLAWVLDDELSITRGVNPMDYCFGEECLRGLRDDLRLQYGAIDALNRAWGASWRDFAEVVPPTTEAARRTNHERPLAEVDFTAWNDHREFMRRSFARVVGELVAAVARDGGRGPAGFTGGQFPSAFGGFEGEELYAACSLVEVYEAGVAPELARGFLPAGGRVVSTLFVPDAAAERAGWSPWELLARAARGDDGAVIWSSGAIFTDDGRDLNDAGRALADVAARAAKLKQLIAELRATPVAAPVAIFESVASVRVGWMVDSWGDGRTWPNRLTSYEAGHSSSATSREAWAAALQAASLPCRFVGARALLSGSLAAEGVRCIVLHEAFALSEAEVAALEQFVRAGGALIADRHVALFDEQLHGRDAGALRRLFGVTRAGDVTLATLAAGEERIDPDPGTRREELGAFRKLGQGTTLHLGRRLADFEGGAGAIGRSLGGRVGEWLARTAGIRGSPRLAADVAGRLRLHRYRIPAATPADTAPGNADAGELLVVVAIAPTPQPLETTLEFDDEVAIEWLEPGRSDAAPASRPGPDRVAIRVDDRHPVVMRSRAAR